MNMLITEDMMLDKTIKHCRINGKDFTTSNNQIYDEANIMLDTDKTFYTIEPSKVSDLRKFDYEMEITDFNPKDPNYEYNLTCTFCYIPYRSGENTYEMDDFGLCEVTILNKTFSELMEENNLNEFQLKTLLANLAFLAEDYGYKELGHKDPKEVDPGLFYDI